MLTLGLNLGQVTHTRGQGGGVSETLIINGVLASLLRGTDGQALMGSDGEYLYGAA